MKDFDRNLSSPSLLKCLVSEQAKNYYPIAIIGLGGGASGKEMVICPSRPDLNPVTDLGFFGSSLLSVHNLWITTHFSTTRSKEAAASMRIVQHST